MMEFFEEYRLALQDSTDSETEDVQPLPRQVQRRRFFERERRNPFDQLTDQEFVQAFAFSKSGVVKLHDLFVEELAVKDEKRTSLTSMEKLLVMLQFLRTNTFYWVVQFIGHILRHKSTVCRTVGAVTRAIARRIDDFVVLPTPEEEEEICRGFFRKAIFPSVRGVLDGSHFEIRKPSRHSDAQDYYNRKSYYSINLMMLGDDRYLIRFLSASHPGSCHDSAIYTTSRLRRELKRTFVPTCPRFVLCDQAYACDDEIIPPLRDRNVLSPADAKFNDAHRRTRLHIENIFGFLKNRFPVLLQKCRFLKFQRMYNLISTCVILHNCAILLGEDNSLFAPRPATPGTEPRYEIRSPCTDNGRTSMRQHIIDNYFQPESQ